MYMYIIISIHQSSKIRIWESCMVIYISYKDWTFKRGLIICYFIITGILIVDGVDSLISAG